MSTSQALKPSHPKQCLHLGLVRSLTPDGACTEGWVSTNSCGAGVHCSIIHAFSVHSGRLPPPPAPRDFGRSPN
eukprot:7931185-Pyramimonas_sp.AAC.1